jgi:hypothetical protein
MSAEGSSPEPGRLGRTLSIKSQRFVRSAVIFVVSDRAVPWLGSRAWSHCGALFGEWPFVDCAGNRPQQQTAGCSVMGPIGKPTAILGPEPDSRSMCPTAGGGAAACRRTSLLRGSNIRSPALHQLFRQRHPRGSVTPRLPSDLSRAPDHPCSSTGSFPPNSLAITHAVPICFQPTAPAVNPPAVQKASSV